LAAHIAACLERACPAIVPEKREARIPGAVRLPLLGEVRTANLSLPMLTALLAAATASTPARWSNAVGGATLILIGALLIFRPEWLAFA
jgi:hypothetical protein